MTSQGPRGLYGDAGMDNIGVLMGQYPTSSSNSPEFMPFQQRSWNQRMIQHTHTHIQHTHTHIRTHNIHTYIHTYTYIIHTYIHNTYTHNTYIHIYNTLIHTHTLAHKLCVSASVRQCVSASAIQVQSNQYINIHCQDEGVSGENGNRIESKPVL